MRNRPQLLAVASIAVLGISVPRGATAQAANGSPCTSGSQCLSGNCVDSRCCNSACSGLCDTCAAAGSLGTCTLRPAGFPCSSNYVCNGAQASCPSFCGSNANCTATSYCFGSICSPKRANGTTCLEPSWCTSGFCADGFCCDSACAAVCDACSDALSVGANGSCSPRDAGVPCDDHYLCDGAQLSCPTACDGDSDCVSTSYCNEALACVPDQADGSPCSSPSQCLSGQCTAGVCGNIAVPIPAALLPILGALLLGAPVLLARRRRARRSAE
jgi:hypothetical protein